MDENGHTILPPGTVPLVEFEVATDDTRLILSPAPSNDPNEPLNWAPWRKYFNFLLIMAMTIAAFTSLQIQTVFWQQMSVDLNLTTSQLNNAQSGNLAGLAVGCIFFIPFTVKYGRRLVYILSICVLAAATWWTARIQSFAELMCTSVICGLAGAINETAVQMTIADMFFVHQRATANACYFASVMIGSFLAPIAGGAQAATQGWRWSYYALAIALTCVSFIFIFCYEETKYVPISNGQREGGPIQTSLDGEAPEKEKLPEGADLTIVASTAMAEPAPPLNTYRQRMRLITKTDESLWKLFVMPLSVITLPHVLFTALQFASAIAWLVLFMPAVSVIFSAPPYSFTTAGVGYMTLGPFVGNALGSLYGGPLSDWSAKWFAKRNGGLYEPEMRLYILPLPIACMASGLIMFGVTADKGMHWILPSVGGALFAFGMGAMGDITFTFTVDTYRELIAEAFVGVAFFRNAFSVAIPFSLVPWMTTMGVSNMFIIIGCLSLAIGLLFIPMIIWGKRIRTALTPRYYHLVDKHAHVS